MKKGDSDMARSYPTNLRTYSNAEIIRLCIGDANPMIEALCSRLEAATQLPDIKPLGPPFSDIDRNDDDRQGRLFP